MSDQVYVEIYNFKTKEVVKCMGPMSESKAERVERGASINLSDDYCTRIVDKPTKSC